MAGEAGRDPGVDPGERAAYDVARLLVGCRGLRRVVEVAATAEVRLTGPRADHLDPIRRAYLRPRPV